MALAREVPYSNLSLIVEIETSCRSSYSEIFIAKTK